MKKILMLLSLMLCLGSASGQDDQKIYIDSFLQGYKGFEFKYTELEKTKNTMTTEFGFDVDINCSKIRNKIIEAMFYLDFSHYSDKSRFINGETELEKVELINEAEQWSLIYTALCK